MMKTNRSRAWSAQGRMIALGAAALLLSGCATATTAGPEPTHGDLTLNVGTLFPLTGSLAQFGPATTAAAQLAASDVNSASAGITVDLQPKDAGDSSTDIAVTSVNDLLSLGVTAIVGPVSNGVAKKVIDQITGAGVVQISPGNTSPDFTAVADNGLYWRTAGSCVLEETELGARIAKDGVASLGIIDQRGFCDAKPGDSVAEAYKAGGGSVVGRATLDDADPGLNSKVASVIAAKPAAIAVIGTQAASIVPLLAAAGFTGSQLYFSGITIGDHSSDFPAGSLTGSIATLPGLDISTLTAFTKRLLKIDPTITDFSYAAETYDAVILLALAALASGETSGQALSSKLQEVSGGSGSGKKATDFASAASIIRDGGVVDYDGYSGPITFDGNGDPTGAIIGFYKYSEKGGFTRLP